MESADGAATLESVERVAGSSKPETFAIEASTASGSGSFTIWGIAAMGSLEVHTTMALNFTNSATMRSPSMVFAGLPVGLTDLYLGAVEPDICNAYSPTACSGNAYSSGGGGYSYSWRSSNNSIAPVSGSNTNPGANFYGQSMSAAAGIGWISSSSCSFQSQGNNIVVRISPSSFTGSTCDGKTQNSKTLDVTFAQGVVLSNSGTTLGQITTTGNVDIVVNSESTSVYGLDAYGKFKYFSGPGTPGNEVGTVTIPFTINANTYGFVTVSPTIPVYCQ